MTSKNVDNVEQEHLEHYETNRERYKDERDSIQKKTFTKWVNKHLKKASRNVDDLFIDLRDGNNLISLLEVLSDENLLRENGSTRFHRIQNIQYCLDWLKMKNIRLVNIRPDEIVEGNGKLTLGLIWTIILNFQVSVIKQRQRADAQAAAAVRAAAAAARSTAAGGGEGGIASPLNASMNTTLEALEGGSAKEALLAWNQRATDGYARVRVANFTSSWRDGLAFAAILHRHRPSAIDWEQINASSMTNRERLTIVFEVAKREFDVDKLLDPEDVDTDKPDEKSIITYVSTLYQNMPCLPDKSQSPVDQAVDAEEEEEGERWAEWTERVLLVLGSTRIGLASRPEAEVTETEGVRLTLESTRIGLASGEGEGEEEGGQMKEFAAVKQEIEQCRTAFEAYLASRSGRAATGDHRAEMMAELAEKWTRIKNLASSRQRDVEEAAAVERLQGELTSLTSWLSVAEQWTNDPAPISRLPEALAAQRREQEERMEEIESRSIALAATLSLAREAEADARDAPGDGAHLAGQPEATQSMAGHDGAACASQERVAVVTQQAVALEQRLIRLTLAARERSEELAAASEATTAWSDGVTSIDGWMETVERKTEVSLPLTLNAGRLRDALEDAKSTIADVSSRRVQFEMTKKRGTALAEQASDSERGEIEWTMERLRKRWDAVSSKADSRCAEAEKAVAEAAAFTDSLANLEEWLGGELAEGAVRKEKGCRGDVDTIVELLSSERAREAQRHARTESIEAITKKAASLVAAGVEEAEDVSAAAARLHGKWAEVEGEAARRREELETAMEEAKDCDEKVCSLLVWLGKLEEQLEVPSSSDLSTGLAAVGAVRAALSDERPRLHSVSEACEALLDGCHPAAEPALREWRRVIEGKWKQVEDRAAAKEESMIEQEERQRASAAMDEERRAVEEHLAEVAQRTAAWQSDVRALEEWMDEAERKMAVAPAKTVDGDRLTEALQEAKSTVADLASRQYDVDVMRGEAVVLRKVVPENERKEMEERGEAVAKRWDAVCAAADSCCAEAEKAAAEGCAFTDALANLEEWLDGELAEGAVRKANGFRGDVDTVASMLSAEKHLEETRQGKAESIEAIREKAASFVAAGVEEAAAVAAAAAALEEKWAEIEDEGARRREELERAMEEAKDCDAKVYGLLGWLVDLEERLEVPASYDRAAQLDAVGSVRGALAAESPRLEEAKRACETLLEGCHPDAEEALKEWRRVVEARWTEVDDLAAAREESLLEEDERQRANEMAMDAAREFEERKRLELDESRWEAESVGEEIDQCADEVLVSLETRKPLPGVPETAEEQMDEFMAVKAGIEQTRIAIEDYLGRTIDAASADEENWLRRNRARLEAKWGRIKDLAATRQRSLEAAAARAEQLDAELVDLRAWLQEAEQSLAEAGPISRLPAGLATQREEQEERMEEVDRRRAAFLDTKSLAGQIRAACDAKDAVYIKNQTVTLDAKLAKFVGRAGERSKQLEAASHETASWLDGVNSLDDWMEEVKSKTTVAPPTTSDVDRLRRALEQAKTTVADVCAHLAQFEHVRRQGVALMEHAPKHERSEIVTEIDEFRKRWDAVCAAADSRCAEAEQALLEGGAFTEALANLEEWLDGELAEGAVRKENGCRGDVDTVTELVYAERKREEARRKKAETIGAIAKKAASLVAEGVEEAAAISAAAARLQGKWKEMEEEGVSRKGELESAMAEAREFDGKVRGLLDWLAEMEGRLEIPLSPSDLSSGLAAAGAVRAALGAELHRLAAVREGCDVLLDGCHLDAEEALKEWRRVVEERWKEVEELAASREKELAEEEERAREREAKLHELNEFVEAKRLELDEASLQSAPASVEEAVFRVAAHGLFEEQLKERQADVDALTKGRRRDGERDSAAEALGGRWRSLWADSIGRAAQLEKDRELQEELKRLERWQYPEWRDRYVEWNDHAKGRVNDLFRRLDRSSTGSVPRAAFIDAILASKFPTTRLEMAKVADRFDRGDGMINGKEFIASLKIGSKVFTPKSPEEQKRMIRSEMTRRREQCCCQHKFRIDHEEDTPGRPQPKSDGGVLQTYRFGDQQIRRMVRILHTTVMVRVGGGWEPLDEFLGKHDPCKAKDRTNTAINARFYDDVRPAHASDKMYDFTKLQHARGDYGSPSSTVTSPAARSSPKETVTVLKPHAQTGTPGVVKGIREKTERSVPMFGENRYSRERAASMELLDTPVSRPSSRASDAASTTTTPSRIPSLRGSTKKLPTATPTSRASRLTDMTNRSPYVSPSPAPTVPRAD